MISTYSSGACIRVRLEPLSLASIHVVIFMSESDETSTKDTARYRPSFDDISLVVHAPKFEGGFVHYTNIVPSAQKNIIVLFR